MAIIAFPTGARIKGVRWALDRPAQVNRSAWTGRRQVVATPGHARWSAEVELAPIVGEGSMLAWRAFLAGLKGQVNTFRLVAVERDQHNNTGTQHVYGAHAAGVTTLRTYGWNGGAQTLQAGHMVTVNDQLLVLTGDARFGAEAGERYLDFEAPLRAPAAHATQITTHYPTALVALTDSTAGWEVQKGQIYGVTLNVEEVF